jgi:hypothetical protein
MIFLRGLQRAAKKWGGLIYTSLDTNLLEEGKEQEIAACADGVLTFEWVQAGPAERRRTLYITKFRRLPSFAGGRGHEVQRESHTFRRSAGHQA